MSAIEELSMSGADAIDGFPDMTQLEPLEPTEAVELYLDEREPEVSTSTLHNQRCRLNPFVEWCDEAEIDNLNDLSGRDLHRFRRWRSKQGISKTTPHSNLQTLRVFLEFCAVIDGVEPGMRERVRMPNVDPEEESRDDKLDADRASDLLDYFDRFEYASRQQIIVAAIWHTGIRLGSLRAFDLDDFDRSAPCLQFRHRPESETPLKNGEAAERSIALGPQYAEMLDDYIKHNRESVENDHGRRPLLTSKQGRLSETAIRNTVYRVTRPCEIGEYPHDRDPDNCEATRHDRASRCPSSRSPHAIRRGAITRHLREGTPEGVVSDRMHVSSGVLDQHYDQRTEREKMEVRRDFIPNA